MVLKRRIIQLVIFLALTVLTQIGGVIYLLALLVCSAFSLRRWYARLLVFAVFYAAGTVSSNFVAPSFGRVPLPCFSGETDTLTVRSGLFCLLNRNYVTPSMRDLAMALADAMNRKFPGTTTVVLDGNFPFVNGFPLLPHISHSDGRKLDIAFYYQDADGNYIDQATRSPLGYFAFEQPTKGDEQPCAGRDDILTTRWDLEWLQPAFGDYELEEKRSAFAIQWLSGTGVERFDLEKIFIEPHLRDRLHVKGHAIRFQGCRAARHDDHIHIQVR